MIEYAQSLGAPGLGYITFADGAGKGPIAKFVPDAVQDEIRAIAGLEDGDAVFLSCDKPDVAARYAGAVRLELGKRLDLIDEERFDFCWIIDYPMFERDEADRRHRLQPQPLLHAPGRDGGAGEARIRSTCSPTSTTSSATGWSSPAARFAITSPISW